MMRRGGRVGYLCECVGERERDERKRRSRRTRQQESTVVVVVVVVNKDTRGL
jgi:hypothetical protein